MIITVYAFRLTMTRSGLSEVATFSGGIVQGLPRASQYISTSESIVWLMNVSTWSKHCHASMCSTGQPDTMTST